MKEKKRSKRVRESNGKNNYSKEKLTLQYNILVEKKRKERYSANDPHDCNSSASSDIAFLAFMYVSTFYILCIMTKFFLRELVPSVFYEIK